MKSYDLSEQDIIITQKSEESRDGKKRRLTEQQKTGIAVFLKNLGNVTATCRELKISKTLWERWIEMPEFLAAKEDAVESKIDILEAAAMKKVSEGDTTMIIYMLKTLGRNRGYSEKVNPDTQVNILNV